MAASPGCLCERRGAATRGTVGVRYTVLLLLHLLPLLGAAGCELQRCERQKRERDRGGGCDRVSERGGQVSKPVQHRGLTVQLHDCGKSATKIKIKNQKCCSECGFRQEETCPVPFPSFGTMKCVLVGRECAAVRADALSLSLSLVPSLCVGFCAALAVCKTVPPAGLYKKI